MAIIKSFASYQNLSNFGTFINDQLRTSEYFRITEFKDTFTGGKNGFLIEGSEHLKETTEIKIEILDVTGTPIYYEPGDGIPEYYEGISKIISVHVYEDTPIGLGKITVLGELKTYVDENGVVRDVPAEWRGIYNIKWERTFNVNKNLANETIVRFYQRPKITIDEINKPIFNITTPSITQTGLVEGIPQQPVYGTDIRNWTAGTLYKLKITDGSNWTSSVDENLIEIPSLGYSATVREVLNNKEIFVDVPYLISSSVSNFPATAYTTTFDHIEGQTIINSALTGSFAKIQLTDLKTFVGDVARVKVYRKSRNEVGDYQFIQDTKLESSEILKDITTTATTELSYGQFTQSNIKNYWISGSTTHPITINVDKLNASVQVDYSGSNYDNPALFITSQSLSLTEGVEYTLSFKTLLSGSNDSTKTLKAYFSGSAYPQQTIVNVTNSAIYTTKQNVTQNVKATKTGDAKLVFEFSGDDWYLANVSLQNAQETSFSPDEFTLIQDIPRKLASETYDFKFEFYDINNNYIPVDVKTSKTFNGGNSFTTTSKILTFESDRTAFRFSSGSFGNPAFQQVGFSIGRTNLTGSVTYASAAFDSNGNYIVPASYAGTYPGGLTNAGDSGASLTIANFSGSVTSVLVGSITYTASCDGLNEFETIYRFEDGDNAPGLFVTANTNQFIYKATDLSLNPTGQIITIEAKRKNLASSIIPLTINSGSGKPPLTIVGTPNPTNGVDTYTLSGTSYPFSTGETIYSISGSDQFGNVFSDAIKITPVKILDGLSVSLTNENASLPALSTGFVASGSFVLTSGSVSVKVGNETITHSNGLAISNSFDVVSAVATGVNTGSFGNSNYLDYSTTNYWIKQLDADSGSLELRVRYKDGAGDTTDVTKVATYTKNKKAAPVLSFVIGNNNQTATAKSTGEQIDTFVTASFAVNEAYDGVSSTKTFTTSSVTATNSYQIGTATNTTLALPTMSLLTDSVDISITGSVVDSENTTRNVFGNISLAKAKKAVPNVLISATPQSQAVVANSIGTQTGTLSNVTIEALEGSTSRFESMVITGTPIGFSIAPTVTGTSNILVMTSAQMNAAEGSITLTVTHTDSEGTSGQTKTIVVRTTKVNIGTDGNNGSSGTNAKTVTITADTYVVTYDGNGSLSPGGQSVILTATQQNFTTPFYEFTQNGTIVRVYSTTPTYTIATLPSSGVSDLYQVNVKEGNVGSVIAFDNTDIFGVKAGTDSYTIFLTNEAHTLPAANDGTVSSFVGSGTSIIVFKGATELNGITSGTPTTGQFKVTSAVTTGTITIGAQTSAGNPVIIADHSTMTSDLATITYTINVENLVTITKLQSLSKSKKGDAGTDGTNGTNGTNGDPGATGADGKRTSTGQIYYQSVSTNAPTLPTATVYTFATNTFTTPTLTSQGWDIGAPTFQSGNTNKYWYSTFTAIETTAGGGTAVPTFSTATQAINFTGLVTFTSTDKITDGTNISNIVPSGSITNHLGGANVTTIDGGKISTGVITSTGYTLLGADTLASGSFMGAGTIINLDNGSLRSKNFYISSAGSAFFSGSVNAGSGDIGGWTIGATTLTGGNAELSSTGNLTLGTINDVVRLSADDATYRIWVGHATAASAPFRVSKAGVLTASSAIITGEITSTVGTIGGWTLGGTTLTGGQAILNSGGSISIGSGASIFKADAQGISLGNATFGNAPFRVTIAGDLFATNASISGSINATSGKIGGWTVSDNTIVDSTNKLKLNAARPAIEIYAGTALRVDISDKDTLSSTTAGSVSISPNSISGFDTQTHSDSNNSALTIYADMSPTDLEYSGASPSFTTGAGVSGSFTVNANLFGTLSDTAVSFEPGGGGGVVSYMNYVLKRFNIGIRVYQAGIEILELSTTIEDSQPLFQNSSYSRVTSIASGNSQGDLNTTITLLPSTLYRFVPFIKNGESSAYRSQGNVDTFDIYTNYYTPKISTISVQQEVGIVELNSKGFQVVASNTRYMIVERDDTNTTFVEIGGGLTATGNITAYLSSDERLKENIIPIGNALDKIEKLDGVEFDWTDEYIKRESNGKGEDGYFFRKHDVGLIAQQVQGVLPEVVVERVDGYLAIKYDRIVPLLVECIKELKKEINELKENK